MRKPISQSRLGELGNDGGGYFNDFEDSPAMDLEQAMESMESFYSVSINAASELSVFDQVLPQEPEDITMVLPRGMRCALSSKLGGYGKRNKLHYHAAKIYRVTVEPFGRKNMVKEILRYGNTAVPEPVATPEIAQLPKVRYGHGVMDTIVAERYERQVFRTQRLQKFETHRCMPALVTERLVPSWRSATTKRDTPATMAQKRLEAVAAEMGCTESVVPTVSNAMKQSEKVHVGDVGETSWRTGGVTEAKELLHPSISPLGNGGAGPVWDELREQKLQELRQSKELWLAHDVRPGGRTPLPVEEEIHDVRQRCKPRLESLSTQYGRNRKAFQNSSDRSAMKSFQRFCKDKKAKAKAEAEEAVKAAAAAERKPEPFRSDLAGVLGMGRGGKAGNMLDLGFARRLSQQMHKSDPPA